MSISALHDRWQKDAEDSMHVIDRHLGRAADALHEAHKSMGESSFSEHIKLARHERELAAQWQQGAKRFLASHKSMMKAITSRCEARWIREYSSAHKTSLELLNAPRKDEHDIETSLEVRTSSLHAHAPPRHLATQSGAAQVT